MKKIFVIMLALIVLLSACGSPSTDGGTTTKADDKTSGGEGAALKASGTIKVLNWGIASEEQLYNEAISRFEEANPGAKVEQTIVPNPSSWNAFIQKWITMISSGNAPDLINVAIEGAKMAMENDLVYPMNDLIKEDKEMSVRVDEFPASLMDGYKDGDKIYGLPSGGQTIVLCYNKTVFDKAGVAYPTDGMTWEQFRSLAAKLTTGEGQNKVYGYGIPSGNFYLNGWFYTNDASPANADWSAPTLNSPNVIETFDFLKGMLEDEISPNPIGVAMASQFASGKVAMFATGRFAFPQWLKDGFTDFDCVTMPTNKGKSSVYGGSYWCISKKASDPKSAFILVKEFLSDETVKTFAKLGQQIPPTESLASDPQIMGTTPQGISKLWKSMSTAKPVCAPSFYGTLETATKRAYESALSGVSSAEALAKAQNEVEVSLKK